MNPSRIQEILRSYRKGEGMEDDPEVRAALEAAMQDPDLQSYRARQEAFDNAFADKLREAPVPTGLQEQILRTARELPSSANKAPASSSWSRWIHPAFLGAAAAIVLFLALSFTFRNPSSAGATGPEFVSVAQELHQSLDPAMVSRDHQALTEFLVSHGAALPAKLPGHCSWDRSFACDVFEVNGSTVSLVCFQTENNGKLHLYTFERSAFPDCKASPKPVLGEGQSAWAAWQEGPLLHVLFNDQPSTENLRRALDI